jgi:hypothetical protein
MPKHELHNQRKKLNYAIMAGLLVIMTALYFLSMSRFGS